MHILTNHDVYTLLLMTLFTLLMFVPLLTSLNEFK